MIHDADSAIRHFLDQVPNDLLRTQMANCLHVRMTDRFRRALLWHLETYSVSGKELSDRSGVSLDVIKKLRTRAGASTTAENAMLIAAYFGKSVNDFMEMRQASEASRLQAMIDLLTPEEQRLLSAQMEGILASRNSG